MTRLCTRAGLLRGVAPDSCRRAGDRSRRRRCGCSTPSARRTGSPATSSEAPGLTDGCAKHGNYLALNGGALTQGEDPAKPGYTAEGDRQTLASSGPQALSSDTRWSDTANPWLLQPISLYRLFDPEVAAAGYDDANAIACMRVAGGRAPRDRARALQRARPTAAPACRLRAQPRGAVHAAAARRPPGRPGDRAEHPAVHARAARQRAARRERVLADRPARDPSTRGSSPRAPQTDVGSGVVVSRRRRARPGRAARAVRDVRRTRRLASRRRGRRCPPRTSSRSSAFETAGLANTIDVTVTTTGAVNVIRVTTPAPNPTLTLNGPGSLTDIAKLTDGEARYDDLDPGPGRRARSPAARPSATSRPRSASRSGGRQGAARAAAGPRRVERPGCRCRGSPPAAARR